MGLNIGGATIATSGTGISLNNGITFNSSGQAALSTNLPGYSGWKEIAGNQLQYSTGSGWPINNALWNNGLNTSTGVFTCPVAGYYAVGFNGIANGGSDDSTTYGYAAFAKNGALSYFIHWNKRNTNGWQQCGGSSVFSCAVGDTLAFFINQSPAPVVANAPAFNRGWYHSNHHAVWCHLIG